VVGTSPLYLPLAASFMTEPYSCFFTALCLYAAICSAEAVSNRLAIFWIWVLAISGILGGSERQSVWSVPFALIPYLFWIRRSDRRFSLHATATFLVCAGLLAFLVSRFTQPYPGLDLSREGAAEVIVQNVIPGSGRMLGLLLACFQVVWPALLCFVPFWRNSKSSKVLGIILVSGALVVVSILSGGGAAPFASSVLSGYGLLPLGGDALGYRPVLLGPALRIALGISIVFSGLFFLFGTSQPSQLPKIHKTIFLISSCAYVPLLIPGAITGLTHDRYVLPLIPALVIFVLSRFQTQGRSVPAAGWTCLIVLATYGIVVAHDYASAARARVEAAQRLESRGIPRNRISAGFEYDAWTQLLAAGRISPIRYHDLMEWNNTNRFWFWNYATALDPEYVAVSSRASDRANGMLPKVAFNTWTMPFRRTVIVRRRGNLPTSKVCRDAQPCFH
jgi:hypothetical protein